MSQTSTLSVIVIYFSSGSRGVPEAQVPPMPLLKLVKRRWPPHRTTGFASHWAPPDKFLDPLLIFFVLHASTCLNFKCCKRDACRPWIKFSLHIACCVKVLLIIIYLLRHAYFCFTYLFNF